MNQIGKKFLLLPVIFLLFFITSCGVGKEVIKSSGIMPLSDKEVNKYINKESRFITIEGTKVHYRDEGKGEVLLLLHGVASSLHTWDVWVEELKDKYRIVRLGIPGFGVTGPIASGEYSRESWVSFLNKFVESIGLKKFSIAGNSMGGFIAWNYSIDYPSKVDKLILIDPVAYPQKCPWIFKLANTPMVNIIAKYIMPKFIVNMNVREVFGDPENIDQEVFDRYFDMILIKGNKASYVKIFQMMVQASNSEKYAQNVKNIPIPTLLMWGSRDKWVPVALIDRWKQDLPVVDCIIYPDVGHIPMEELPYLSAYHADKFLKDKEVKDVLLSKLN